MECQKRLGLKFSTNPVKRNTPRSRYRLFYVKLPPSGLKEEKKKKKCSTSQPSSSPAVCETGVAARQESKTTALTATVKSVEP